MKESDIKRGDIYGSLTVIGDTFRKKKNVGYGTRAAVLARCSCGKAIEVFACNLINGNTTSCGCKRWKARVVHGASKTKLYHVYSSMKNRCQSSANKSFANYGGRGISVCDEWMSDFLSFRKWAEAHGYREGLDIDRIDNNGNYCPENCRIVTRTINSRNKRTTKFVTAFGETKSVPDWADDPRCTVSRKILYYRIDSGYQPEIAITTPKRCLS